MDTVQGSNLELLKEHLKDFREQNKVIDPDGASTALP